jgi:hypothetical protein
MLHTRRIVILARHGRRRERNGRRRDRDRIGRDRDRSRCDNYCAFPIIIRGWSWAWTANGDGAGAWAGRCDCGSIGYLLSSLVSSLAHETRRGESEYQERMTECKCLNVKTAMAVK